MAARSGPAVRDVLAGDEVAEVLRETFFAPDVPISESVGERTRVRRKPSAQKPRPDHYKVICISMYTEDLARLDAAVRELKKRGYTKANRSAVLRAAMQQLDLARVPRGL